MVLTDSNPLTYGLTSAKLDAIGQRWASALGECDFDIFYQAGLRNSDADGMSRYPHDRVIAGDKETNKLDNQTVKTICYHLTLPYYETLPTYTIDIVEATEKPGAQLAQIEFRQIRNQQRQDPVIDRWRIATTDRQIPNKTFTREDLTMKRQFHHFKIKRGILYRIVQENDKALEQLVLPQCYRKEILRGLHDNIGHLGRERLLRLLRERYY